MYRRWTTNGLGGESKGEDKGKNIYIQKKAFLRRVKEEVRERGRDK